MAISQDYAISPQPFPDIGVLITQKKNGLLAASRQLSWGRLILESALAFPERLGGSPGLRPGPGRA